MNAPNGLRSKLGTTLRIFLLVGAAALLLPSSGLAMQRSAVHGTLARKRAPGACGKGGCPVPERPRGCRRTHSCPIPEPDIESLPPSKEPTPCGDQMEDPWSNGTLCTVKLRDVGGEEVFTISNPVVVKRTFEYRMVHLESNEEIFLEAGGCVQTGGAGKTWKRYVNPSGRDSGPGPARGEHYHGVVAISGGFLNGSRRLGGEEPIQRFLPTHALEASPRVLIPAQLTGVPALREPLVLGYYDTAGNYGDNGYYKHDDGNNHQCGGSDGGNAWVIVHVKHVAGLTVSVPPNPPELWDVIASTYDANGFPLDPEWGWQKLQEPSTTTKVTQHECTVYQGHRHCITDVVDVTHEHGVGDYQADCGAPGTTAPPSCTSVDTHYNPAEPGEKEPFWLSAAAGVLGTAVGGPTLGIAGGVFPIFKVLGVCTQGGAFSSETPLGHLNWEDVTYDGGTLAWDSWDKPANPVTITWGAPGKAVGDNDITLRYEQPAPAPPPPGQPPQRRGRPGVAPWKADGNERTAIELEFNADESVNKLHAHWWETFDYWAHQTWATFRSERELARQEVHRMVDGRRAVVSGMLGLDQVHTRGQSEIHPVHALAIETADAAQTAAGVQTDTQNWAVFGRNWGNEGMCSSEQVELPVNHIVTRLLPPVNTGPGFWLPVSVGGTPIRVGSPAGLSIPGFEHGAGGSGVATIYAGTGGVYVDMPLGNPEKRPWFGGELSVAWRYDYPELGAPVVKGSAAAAHASPAHASLAASAVPGGELEAGLELDGDSPEARLFGIVDHLGSTQATVVNGLSGAWRTGTAADSLAPGVGTPVQLAAATSPPKPALTPRARYTFDAEQVASVRDHDLALYLATAFGHSTSRITRLTTCVIEAARRRRLTSAADPGVPGYYRRPRALPLVPGLSSPSFVRYVRRTMPACRR